LSEKLKRLRKKVREKNTQQTSTTSKKILPADPVQFCREWLHYEPFEYMWPFLRDRSHFIANLQARQTGKTFNGMAKILYLAFKHPYSIIIVTSPTFDQTKNIAFKALKQHLTRMKAHDPNFFELVVGKKNILRTMIRLQNGSQILAESPVPETIRGHTAKVVYIMECNFIRYDMDLYTAVLFTLNTTNGYLIAEGTPWNTDSVFYKMHHDPAYSTFSRHIIEYTRAVPPKGPLSLEVVEIIKAQLSGDPSRWKREMLCEWTEDTNTWLTTSLIALAQDHELELVKKLDDKVIKGNLYIGVDFGKHLDHSVVAVLDVRGGHKYLIHLKQFPLETPYGSVIGYMKLIQDHWQTVRAIYADKTGVGEYVVEDMLKGGLRNVEGINFTDTSKEAMATALKESMLKAECLKCGWTGYIEDGGEWRTTCPKGCRDEETTVPIRPELHLPYDIDLFNELNVERFELSKTGKLLFRHPEGTHDDRFWALALAVYAVELAPLPASKPIGRII
jgi:hypothetical protein